MLVWVWVGVGVGGGGGVEGYVFSYENLYYRSDLCFFVCCCCLFLN